MSVEQLFDLVSKDIALLAVLRVGEIHALIAECERRIASERAARPMINLPRVQELHRFMEDCESYLV